MPEVKINPFIKFMEELRKGAFESPTGARRAVGKACLPEGEKSIALAAVDAYFTLFQRTNALAPLLAERTKLEEEKAAIDARLAQVNAEVHALLHSERTEKEPIEEQAPSVEVSTSSRRSEAEIDTTAERISTLLYHKARRVNCLGLTAEQIKAELGIEGRDHDVPIERLLLKGEIEKTGNKRGTRYRRLVKQPERKKDCLSSGTNGVTAHVEPDVAFPSLPA